jgi:2-iminobutanoate/2-iminopropanoate deaminase
MRSWPWSPGAAGRRMTQLERRLPLLRETAAESSRELGRTKPKGNETVTKTGVHTAHAPQPAGPYSQGIVANGLFYTAGFGPQDPTNGNAVADNVADQTRQVLRNIQAVLAERGRTLDDCLKTTVHLADLGDFAEFNAAYGRGRRTEWRCTRQAEPVRDARR